LVLGAGGPVGFAFHAGVLRALAEHDFDARRADLVVGTSAGAIAGAMLRAELGADELFAGAVGDPASPITRLFARAKHRPLIQRTRRWPGSAPYLREALRRPWSARPGNLVSALLPEGERDNRPLTELMNALHPERWPARPLWITAVHLDSGATVAFGRDGAPAIDVATAVRCSSAVPGIRRPVDHQQRRFVDGGIASPTHLDLVDADHAPVAIVISPLSRFAPLKLLLRAEMRRLERRGVRVIAFEPDGEVVARMGWNPLDPQRAPAVADAAYRMARRGCLETRALRDALFATV
jgi:NTE family protein